MAPGIAWGQDAVWGTRMGGLRGGAVLDVAPVGDGSGDFYVCGEAYEYNSGNYVFGPRVLPVREGALDGSGLLGGDTDAFVARYDENQNPLWVRIGRGARIDRAISLAVLPDTSVVIVGATRSGEGYNAGVQFEGGGNNDILMPGYTFDETGFMARYESNGDLDFARRITMGGHAASKPLDVVALPGSGEGYVVVGNFRGSRFGDDNDPSPIGMFFPGYNGSRVHGFVAGYKENGDIIWVQQVESSSQASGIDGAALLPDGDLILSGHTGRSVPVVFFPGHAAEFTLAPSIRENRFLMRLSDYRLGALDVLWEKTFGTSGAGDLQELSVSPSGELYIGGKMNRGYQDSNGAWQPPTYASGDTLVGPQPGDQVFLPDNGIWDRGFVAKVDPDGGDLLWSAGSTRFKNGVGIEAMSDGVLVVHGGGGEPYDLLNADPTFSGNHPVGATIVHGHHSKWDPDGNVLWARSDLYVEPWAVAMLDSTCALVGGTAFAHGPEALDWGEPTQIALGAPRLFSYVAKYAVASGPTLTVPNPITPLCDPGSGGASVSFDVVVTNSPSGSILEARDVATGVLVGPAVANPAGTVTFGPAFFPFGLSTLDITLSDSGGGVLIQDSVSVVVDDTIAPTIAGCAATTIECAGVLTWLYAAMFEISAVDDCDAAPTLLFDPPEIPVGTTSVTVRATDSSGNFAECTFDVTVEDTFPPEFTETPEDQVVEALSGSSAEVAFLVEAEDACGAVTLVCRDQHGNVVDPAGTFFGFGVHTITCTATDPGGLEASLSFDVTVLNGVVDPALSSVAAEPAIVSAYGGTATVTVTPRNTSGEDLGSGRAVAVSTTGGALLDSVVDEGSGTYTQDLQAVTGFGGGAVSANVGGTLLNEMPFVTFVPVEPDLSTVEVSPTRTLSGGTALVTVTPLDDLGLAVGPGRLVEIATTQGVLLGSVEDLGDGRYTQFVQADLVGTANLTAVVDGLALNVSASLTIEGTPGVVIGLDASENAFGYATIQEAVDRVADDGLTRILASPGSYPEVVLIKNHDGLTLESLDPYDQAVIGGLKVSRSSNIALRYLTLDGSTLGSSVLIIRGAVNKNENVLIESCTIRNSKNGFHGLKVGRKNVNVTVDHCDFINNGRNGLLFELTGGPYTVSNSLIHGNGYNGVKIGKKVEITLSNNSIQGNGTRPGEGNGRYGILRVRTNGTGTPQEVTLLQNTIAGNCGKVVAGKADANIKNYDQVIDATDDQPPYE